MAEKGLINGQPEQDIEHCATCAHDEDSVEICVLRNCKYAITKLIDCYEHKQSERMTNGHWIFRQFPIGSMYICSECRDVSCCRYRFCPSCGAKMDGFDEE